MTGQKKIRRNYFIKKEFQVNFILRFCGLAVLGSVISGVILYLFSRGAVTTTFVNSRLSIMSTADYVLPALLGSSIITIAFISIVTAGVVMYLSHRIAGPLYKIEKSIKEVGAGNLTVTIKLRSTDEITKMADCFNEMAGGLKTHLLEIKARACELSGEIDGLKKKELDKAIDYFKVGDKE